MKHLMSIFLYKFSKKYISDKDILECISSVFFSKSLTNIWEKKKNYLKDKTWPHCPRAVQLCTQGRWASCRSLRSGSSALRAKVSVRRW